jgi:hypothetical protein
MIMITVALMVAGLGGTVYLVGGGGWFVCFCFGGLFGGGGCWGGGSGSGTWR